MIQKPNVTPVPDEIFDYWLPELTLAELRVLLYITRKTLGYHKERDDISLNQIADGITRKKDGVVIDRGTGLHRSTVAEAINELEKKELIVTTQNTSEKGHRPTTYSLYISDDPPSRRCPTTLVAAGGQGVVAAGGHTRNNIQETTLQEENPYTSPSEEELENPTPTLNLTHKPEEGSQQERAGVAGLKNQWRWPQRVRQKPRSRGLTTKVQEEVATTKAETGLISNGTASPTVDTPGLAQRFLGLWNAVFPEAPVTWHPSYSHYPAFSDPEFEPAMVSLCNKVKELCDSDEFFNYLNFDYVLGFKGKTRALVWPGVLHLKPKHKKPSKQDAVQDMVRKVREKLNAGTTPTNP